MKYIKKLNINFDDWDDINEKPFNGHNKFYNFLIKNKILNKYIYNYNKYKLNNNFLPDLNNFLNNSPQERFLTNSFLWRKTTEGHNFWSKKDDKWLKKLSNGYLVDRLRN